MLQPNIVCDKIYDIDPAVLQQMGIKALALDIDNTLTLHDSQEVPPKVALFLEEMKSRGMGLFLVSNNSFERVQPYAAGLGLEFVCRAAKPLTFGLSRACRRFGLDKKEIMLVGDQLFTDAYGGKHIGMRAIIVPPIKDKKTLFFRFKRMLERPIMKSYYREKNKNCEK